MRATGLYLYMVNQRRVDTWPDGQGIRLPGASASDPGALTLEELLRQKEKLEDLIAERGFAASQMASVSTVESETKKAELALV